MGTIERMEQGSKWEPSAGGSQKATSSPPQLPHPVPKAISFKS